MNSHTNLEPIYLGEIEKSDGSEYIEKGLHLALSILNKKINVEDKLSLEKRKEGGNKKDHKGVIDKLSKLDK